MPNDDYVKNIEEDTDATDDGEVIKTLKDFKVKGQEIIASLERVDDILSGIQKKLESGQELDKADLLYQIRNIRSRIGDVSKEEELEIGEQKVVINLLNKLRKWVEEMT